MNAVHCSRFLLTLMVLLAGLVVRSDAIALTQALPDRVLKLASIPGNPLDRIGVPLMREVYRQAGVDVIVQEIPPARALQMLEREQLDGVVARLDGLETRVPEAVKVPVPLTHLSLVVFARADQLSRLRGDADAPFRLGLLRGVRSGISTERPIEPIYANTTEQLMTMLEHRRIDVAIDIDLVGAFYIQRDHLRHVRIVSPPIQVMPVYHYIHEQHRDLLPQLTAIMMALQQRGDIEAPHAAFRDRLDLGALTVPLAKQISLVDLKIERRPILQP